MVYRNKREIIKMGLQVDIDQIKEFLNDDGIMTMKTSNLSGVTYTTIRDLHMNITELDKLLFLLYLN